MASVGRSSLGHIFVSGAGRSHVFFWVTRCDDVEAPASDASDAVVFDSAGVFVGFAFKRGRS